MWLRGVSILDGARVCYPIKPGGEGGRYFDR